jgi:hypothetical protein
LLVGTIGESFTRGSEARTCPSRDNLRLWKPEENHCRVDCAGGLRDGVCQGGITHRHVEKSPMRFDVLQPHPFRRGDGGKRPNLVGDEILDVARQELELSPPESFGIWKARMGPDGDAVVASQHNGRPHDGGIPRVKSACHICRGDMGHELGIHAIWHGQLPHFAEVSVEVDAHGSDR